VAGDFVRRRCISPSYLNPDAAEGTMSLAAGNAFDDYEVGVWSQFGAGNGVSSCKVLLTFLDLSRWLGFWQRIELVCH
jgi:hypothetical protein